MAELNGSLKRGMAMDRPNYDRFEAELKEQRNLETRSIIIGAISAFLFTPLFWLLACIFFQLEQ